MERLEGKFAQAGEASADDLDVYARISGNMRRLLESVGLQRRARDVTADPLEYAARNIRVNAIAPGPILTEQLQRAGETVQRSAAQAIPMRRIGRPEEVAATVLWLCSDAASFLTGATIPLDGGKLAGMAPFARHTPAR